MPPTSTDLPVYVTEIQRIGSVPHILETVAALTGLGFVAIAHVTEQSWTTCAVLDKLGIGLQPGDGLDVTTTLCEEVRDKGNTIVIDEVRASAQYRDHHTPRIYGFQSYFSVPIRRADGSYFGSLCGLDTDPANLSTPAMVSTLELFAELISKQLESEQKHSVTQRALLSEREASELREQFIAVLGHDLRTPLGAIANGVDLLRLKHPDPEVLPLLQRMRRSVTRMSTLVDDVVDFTRGRMGGGIALHLRREDALALPFGQVLDELRELHPDSDIRMRMQPGIALLCDAARLSQLLSNLVKNAIVHGDPDGPVSVDVTAIDGVFSMAVQNHGAPLMPEQVEQLFKPFRRAASGSTHDGLGLGLYIVSEIAAAHGGAMDVTSRDGAIVFRFTMPLEPADGRRALT